jgi:hypothetical protein
MWASARSLARPSAAADIAADLETFLAPPGSDR